MIAFVKEHKGLLLLLAAAFLLRLGFFFAEKPWQPNFIYDKIIMIDSGPYHEFAVSVLKNHSFAEAGTYRTPGYPLFLALFYAVFGINPWVVILAQVFLGTITVALVYWWSMLWFNRKTALIAAGLFAVDPHVIIYSGCLLTEALFVFLIAAAVIAWWYGVKQQKVLLFGAAGLLIGYATLVRPVALLFPIAVLGVSLFFNGNRWRFKALSSFVFLAAFSLMLLPWAYRNYRQYGHFSLTDVNGFNMLFVNAAYTEVAKTGKSYDQVCKEFSAIAEGRGATKDIDPFVRSSIYRSIAVDYLKENRALFFRRYLVGTVTLFTNVASTDTADLLGFKRIQFKYNVYEFNKFSNMISWYVKNKTRDELIIGTSILLFLLLTYALTFLGLFDTARRKDYAPLFVNLAFGLYFVAITGLFGVARYRLPVIPFYIPFAAAGFVKARELLTQKNRKAG